MGLTADDLLTALKAIAEETRLRIVALLQHGELSVTDLTDILGQSQPRISRHLKLLTEAGIVDKHREGTWAFFELVSEGPIAALVSDILATTGRDDSTFAADLDRLTVVRVRRSATAQQYFADIAANWDSIRSLHAPEQP
jgi:DNA-binding transcriptional ArsR family regulator